MKKILVLFVLSLIGCNDVRRSTSGPSRQKECQVKCQEKYGSDLDYVGGLSGDCYCK